MKKGDKVKLLGNYPKYPEGVYGTIIRKGHKDHWVVKFDALDSNREFNEKSLEVVEKIEREGTYS